MAIAAVGVAVMSIARILADKVISGPGVYLEKPVSHNVWEGRQSVKAARKQVPGETESQAAA